MTHDDALTALLEYLRDKKRYQVIALTGPWGSGKTHLWTEVSAALETSQNPTGGDRKLSSKTEDASELEPSPLYCSLFGLDSVESVRMKLFTANLNDQSPRAAAVIEKANKYQERIETMWGAAGALGKALGAAVHTVAGGVAEGYLGHVLRGRLIVLDDLERRKASLDVVEVLGFIESLRAQNCQVLAIFNEEKIGDEASRNALSSFREKAFDIEMRLTTEPGQAFRIAYKDADFSFLHEETVRDAIIFARISNIRIAKRAIAVARHAYAALHGETVGLPLKETMRAVSVATNIFYEGLPDAPTLQQVLSELKTTPSALSPEAAGWFYGVDYKFLSAVVNHLQTGDLRQAEFKDYWMVKRQHRATSEADAAADSFMLRTLTRPNLTHETVLSEANSLLPQAKSMSPSKLAALVIALRDSGYQQLAGAFAMSRPLHIDRTLRVPSPRFSLQEAITVFLGNHSDNQFDHLEMISTLNQATEEKYVALLMSKESSKPSFSVVLAFLKKWADERYGAGGMKLGIALNTVFGKHPHTRREAVIRAHLAQSDALEVMEYAMEYARDIRKRVQEAPIEKYDDRGLGGDDH